ncbi:hypothetical protein F4561_004173 [Lipingzhangella halophila]|uniref:Uncharacterized protein n=1 Tax=Lipingzhangella halophila TaxID=1783352 RepID=A0A7W7RKP8_9ACTN|nr:hypothetical protein [Lipingzhangella halophila]MBB4933353.1 hypothetical protein [Lipingzhangella halophila]
MVRAAETLGLPPHTVADTARRQVDPHPSLHGPGQDPEDQNEYQDENDQNTAARNGPVPAGARSDRG